MIVVELRWLSNRERGVGDAEWQTRANRVSMAGNASSHRFIMPSRHPSTHIAPQWRREGCKSCGAAMRSGNLPNLEIIKSSPDFLQKWEFPAHGISVLPATLAILHSAVRQAPSAFYLLLDSHHSGAAAVVQTPASEAASKPSRHISELQFQDDGLSTAARRNPHA